LAEAIKTGFATQNSKIIKKDLKIPYEKLKKNNKASLVTKKFKGWIGSRNFGEIFYKGQMPLSKQKY
jgi:hypothetical protein